jgi:type I site-specific restriction endonuclease
MMTKLNLPNYQFRLKEEDKKTKIFDSIRKKYVVLTPEEWVRQHIIEYLIQEKDYPRGLIMVETSLKQNGRARRSDIVCYHSNKSPILLVECKAPEVKITQEAFDQISRYNIAYRVPLLLVSNGINHFVCKVNFNDQTTSYLREVPNYKELFKND